jgi:CubicO group peptidase (beta-lactamase class C family)
MKRVRLLFLFIAIIAATFAQPAALSDLDAYALQAIKTFEIPGISVAVVKDGEVVLAKGYGVRKLGENTPVDAHTLFGIGSNTKAFTTAALGMLVDEGKLSWDDAAISRLPGFQMYDPYVTREMTIRDLLTHRSGLGLGAGDLLFFPPSTYTRDEIIGKLRYIKPATSFRSKYAYDNLLYLVAGQIIAAVSGKQWPDFIRERILGPVNMTETDLSIVELRQASDVATPHAKVDGSVQPIAAANIDNSAPAGAINSSATDMAKWMIVQLNGGRISADPERRLFKASTGREMWSAQTILPVGEPPPGLEALRSNFAAYGLGWGLAEYRGHKQVGHTGGLPGYVSKVTMIPDLKLGVVVLTNQENGGAMSAITNRILDAYMGAAPMDWTKIYHSAGEQQRLRAEAVEKSLGAKRATDSKPSLTLEKYAGKFTDSWYGEIDIAKEQSGLVLRFSHTPQLTGDLEHWQYDTFKARWRDRSLNADAFVTFALNPDGSISQIKMVPVSPLTDFSFDFQDLLITPMK